MSVFRLGGRWMNHGLGPFERRCILVVGLHKLINRLAQLYRRREANALESLLAQNAEPTFHLIQPRGIRRSEMQMDSRMAPEPPVFFGLVSIQVVQHDVDVAVRVGGYNLIHEIQKLSPPPAMVMACDDLPGSDVESRKQGRGPVPLVPVAEAIQRLAVGEAQPALRSF